MYAMVTARVPSEIRDQVNAQLRNMGSSATELVNAAYDYVLRTGHLPDPAADEASPHITLTDAQINELKFRLHHATRPAPQAFWEARDGAELTD